MTPTGSLTWSNSPYFDEAGYNQALQAYNKDKAAWDVSGGKAPGTPQFQGYDANNEPIYSDPTANGGYNPPVGTAPTAPNRADYNREQWTQTTNLSPEQQALYDTNTKTSQGLADNAQDTLSKPRDTAGMLSDYKDVAGPTYSDETRKRVENAVLDFYNRNTEPVMERQRKSMQNDLIGMGFSPGDAGGGFSTAMGDLNRSQNNARLDALDRAVTTGGSEARADFATQLSGSQFASDQQKARLAQQLTKANAVNSDRSGIINELSALRSGSTVNAPQLTGQAQAAGATPPNLMGAAESGYNAQVGNVNASNAATNSLYSGLLSLAGSYFGAGGAAAGNVIGRNLGAPQYQPTTMYGSFQ